MAKLQELGFKNIKVVKVLGDNECVAKIMANGATVKKMQKVALNTRLTMQVYDGRLAAITDSLMGEEALANYRAGNYNDYDEDYDYDGGDASPDYSQKSSGSEAAESAPAATSSSSNSTSQEEESIEFF